MMAAGRIEQKTLPGQEIFKLFFGSLILALHSCNKRPPLEASWPSAWPSGCGNSAAAGSVAARFGDGVALGALHVGPHKDWRFRAAAIFAAGWLGLFRLFTVTSHGVRPGHSSPRVARVGPSKISKSLEETFSNAGLLATRLNNSDSR